MLRPLLVGAQKREFHLSSLRRFPLELLLLAFVNSRFDSLEFAVRDVQEVSRATRWVENSEVVEPKQRDARSLATGDPTGR